MNVHLTWCGWRVRRPMVLLVTTGLAGLITAGVLSSPTAVAEKSSGADASQASATDSNGDGVVERPDAVSAGFTARALNQPVEDLSRRTETSTTSVNPDGTSTLEASAGTQRLRNEDGAWEDIDLDLTEQSDGTFVPKVAVGDVVVGGGGSKLAATVKLDDDQALSVTWPETLPEPTVEGGVATYELSETSDLLVITTKTGVAARIRLNEQPAPDDPALTMGLRTENLSVDTTAEGTLDVTDDAGKAVASTAPMVAWDAQVDEDGDPTNVVAVQPTLDKVSNSGDVTRSELTLDPKPGFLDDPDTEYPVIIDPDISAVTFSKDTMVRKGATNPQGTDPRLWAGRIEENTSVDRWISYVQWSNTQLSGRTIISATAKFYQYGAGNCGRQLNVHPLTSSFTEGGTVYTNRPSNGTANWTSTTAGPCGSTNGWLSINVKNMVQAWASGTANHGIRLGVPGDYATNYNFTRRFCSANENAASSPCHLAARNPVLSVTYNTPPTVSGLSLSPSDSTDSVTYVGSEKPTLSALPSDQESAVAVAFEIHNSTAGTAASLKSSCSQASVAQGNYATCTPPTGLTHGTTYYARVKATDPHGAASGWSGWESFKVDTSAPSITGVSCTNGISMDEWYETRPAETTNCSVAVSNAQRVWLFIGNSETGTLTGGDKPIVGGSAATGALDIPKAGAITIRARVFGFGGGKQIEHTVGFGVGPGMLELPLEGDRSTSTFPIQATGPTPSVSAKLQWRRAPETPSPEAGWADATDVETANGQPWTGLLDAAEFGRRTPDGLIWDPTADLELAGITGSESLVETRVVFSGPFISHYASAIRRVTVVPHAFGGSFPTVDLGPGQVSLFTGEFQFSASDANEMGLSIGRSHLSEAGQHVGGPTGIFGPGWVSDLDGGTSTAGFSVIDRTGSDGSITLVDPEGESFVYRHDSSARGALEVGTYVPVGENAVNNNRLKLTVASGEATFRLTLVEQDGTTTDWATEKTVSSWTETSTADFWVEQTRGAGDGSTTTFAADAEGRTKWIFAPAPPGVSCDASTRERGCRALELQYTGTGSATRLSKVWAHVWDPERGTSGEMDRVAVAEYVYEDGKLVEAWDPRINPALKTTYAYAGPAARPRLVRVTEPGLKPWQIVYDSNGRVNEISRERPSGTSTATWTVDYSIGLNEPGDGFPDLSPAATESWGQSDSANLPVDGAAVYASGIPTGLTEAERNEYAAISYFTANGRITNTAKFGAGRWQIDALGYDDSGSVVTELTAAARLKVIAEGAAAASKYSTLTVYNEAKEAAGGEVALDAGIRVEQVYGPMREVLTDAGETIVARELVETDYEDEVAADLRPGRPSAIPDGGYNLPVRERVSATTDPVASATPTRIDVSTTRFEYAPVVSGDGDGWLLGAPTKTVVGVGTPAESTTITRFDKKGRIFQTRTPEGVATAEQSRWTNTVYYSAGGGAVRPECRNKPEWTDLVCWTGPANQPGGAEIPETSVTKYSSGLEAARTVESVGGNERRVKATVFDAAGREVGSQVSTPGVSDTDVPMTTTTYSSSTGLPIGVNDGVTELEAIYDSWGRVTSSTDGTGNTSTTTYDAAGRVATAGDGKGSVTYHYDGIDAAGKSERRGLATRLETGVGSVQATAAYDAEANLAVQKIDDVTTTWTHDVTGFARQQVTDLGIAGQLAFGQTPDAAGLVRIESQARSAQVYTYDGRGRLTRVTDTSADGGCVTRKYDFSLDSNRTGLATYAPTDTGGCQTSTAASTIHRTFDAADRVTFAGYAYDVLGRTTTLPSADTRSGGGVVEVSYHANDMVRTLAQGQQSQTYELDPGGRIKTLTTDVDGVDLAQMINHYDTTSDSPAWTTFRAREDAFGSWVESWTRYVSGVDGGLALKAESGGLVQLQLTNLGGDIIGTWDLTGEGADTLTGYAETTEYGLPAQDGSSIDRFGWLGSHQRDSRSALADLTLMGVRLYNPATGRFLSRDPIVGGNDNTYVYPPDPINHMDLSGEAKQLSKKKSKKVRQLIKKVRKLPKATKQGRGWGDFLSRLRRAATWVDIGGNCGKDPASRACTESMHGYVISTTTAAICVAATRGAGVLPCTGLGIAGGMAAASLAGLLYNMTNPRNQTIN